MTLKETKIVCSRCGELNSRTAEQQEVECMSCGKPVVPPPSFKWLWSKGYFDSRDYYILTADLKRWCVTDLYEYISESVPPVTGDDRGVVTYKYSIYVYSDLHLARWRSETFGGGVEPLKLHCLACFYRVASAYIPVIDTILDEQWHIQCYTCRESDYSGITHARLYQDGECFQLEGCAGQGNLHWRAYLPYANSNLPPEYCRPIPFPTGHAIMQDHTAQGGPVDMEILHPAESLSYVHIAGVTFAVSPLGLLARPLRGLAFAPTMGEKSELTRGNGLWIPISIGRDGSSWTVCPWARNWRGYVEAFVAGDVSSAQCDTGPQLHINEAFARLEGLLNDEDSNDANKWNEVSELVDSALNESPGEYSANEMRSAFDSWPREKLSALLHADRSMFLLTHKGPDLALEEAERALAINPRSTYALYRMAQVHRAMNDSQEYAQTLGEVLRINPNHARALVELAFLAGESGDSDAEIEGYQKAAKADPYFPDPLYDLAITYNDIGEYQKAFESYSEALKRKPDHTLSLENLAILLFNHDRDDSAWEVMFRLLEGQPYRDKSYATFCDMLSKAGKEDLLNSIFSLWMLNVPQSELRDDS